MKLGKNTDFHYTPKLWLAFVQLFGKKRIIAKLEWGIFSIVISRGSFELNNICATFDPNP